MSEPKPVPTPFVFPDGRTRIQIMADDSDGGDAAEDDVGGGHPEFVILGGGRYFVKKWAIDGMSWEPFYADGDDERRWKLFVYFADFKIPLYGEEATDLLEQFGLPTEPPE